LERIVTEPNRTCILLTENDVLIRNLIGTILSNAGYCVLAAANDAEAIELSRNFTGQIRLMIGKSSGLAATLRKERPDTRVILLSAKATSALKKIVRSVEPGAFLQQASLPQALNDSIQSALTSPEFDGGIVEI
jgi:DNA-binding response OmpR family regulator